MNKLVLAIVAILGLVAGITAKSYSIAYYGFDIVVNPSGCDATITETITYSFLGDAFGAAERSIALKGDSGYPSQVTFIKLFSPDTTTSVTSEGVIDREWFVQWKFPPASGQVTFVIIYKVDVLFTKNKGAQNYFDYVLIGAEWQNFASFEGGFHNIHVAMTLPSLLFQGLSFSPSYTNKFESNGTTVVTWIQSYWSPGSIYDVTATFDVVNPTCRISYTPTHGWVIAVIVIACTLVVLGVVVAILRCMWRRGYTIVGEYDGHQHHDHRHSHHHDHNHDYDHHHHHSSSEDSSSAGPARTGGGGAW